MDGVKERTPADFARFSDTELMNVIHGAMIAYGVAMEDAGEMMRKVESVVRELAIRGKLTMGDKQLARFDGRRKRAEGGRRRKQGEQ